MRHRKCLITLTRTSPQCALYMPLFARAPAPPSPPVVLPPIWPLMRPPFSQISSQIFDNLLTSIDAAELSTKERTASSPLPPHPLARCITLTCSFSRPHTSPSARKPSRRKSPSATLGPGGETRATWADWAQPWRLGAGSFALSEWERVSVAPLSPFVVRVVPAWRS